MTGNSKAGFLDAQYVETWSLGLDLRIILETIASVLRREGISHAGERMWTGTLEGLAQARWPDEGLPGTLVIGDVVSLAQVRPAATADAVMAR